MMLILEPRDKMVSFDCLDVGEHFLNPEDMHYYMKIPVCFFSLDEKFIRNAVDISDSYASLAYFNRDDQVIPKIIEGHVIEG